MCYVYIYVLMLEKIAISGNKNTCPLYTRIVDFRGKWKIRSHMIADFISIICFFIACREHRPASRQAAIELTEMRYLPVEGIASLITGMINVYILFALENTKELCICEEALPRISLRSASSRRRNLPAGLNSNRLSVDRVASHGLDLCYGKTRSR